jgi:hypothetical protein
MEDYVTDIVKLGVFLVAHAAIYANRTMIRPAVNNDKYNDRSLQLEHLVSYATLPLASSVLFKYLGFNSTMIPICVLELNAVRAVGGDLILPALWHKQGKEGYNGPQYDQFASDVAGTLAYLAFLR